VIKVITAWTKPLERAGVFAGVYLASYMAFSVPVLLAGLVLGAVELVPTVLAYGGLALVLVVTAMFCQALANRTRFVRAPTERVLSRQTPKSPASRLLKVMLDDRFRT
jgi:hypothetical protein